MLELGQPLDMPRRLRLNEGLATTLGLNAKFHSANGQVSGDVHTLYKSVLKRIARTIARRTREYADHLSVGGEYW